MWLLTRARSTGGWGRAMDKIIGEKIKKVKGQDGEGSTTWIWKSPGVMTGGVFAGDDEPRAKVSTE